MRIRSRVAETEDVNERRLRRGSVTTTKVPPRAVRNAQQWPGMERPISPKNLSPDLVQELDARFTTGETVTLVAAGITATGQVPWDSVVRGDGFAVEEPDPLCSVPGYYDFHVQVVSNDGPIRGLTISATGSETVGTDPTPFCTVWRGVVPHVLATPGDPLTIDLGWTGTADVDVTLTVGLVEPITVEAADPPVEAFGDAEFNNGTSCALPAGRQPGDRLFVFVNTAASITGNSTDTAVMNQAGWTQIVADTGPNFIGQPTRTFAWTKIWQGDEGYSSISWTGTPGDGNTNLRPIATVRVTPSDIGNVAADTTRSTGTLNLPVSVGDGSLVLLWAASSTNGGDPPPPDWLTGDILAEWNPGSAANQDQSFAFASGPRSEVSVVLGGTTSNGVVAVELT